MFGEQTFAQLRTGFRRLYSAVSLTLGREQRFIRSIIIIIITLFAEGQQCWPLLCTLVGLSVVLAEPGPWWALALCWLSQGPGGP